MKLNRPELNRLIPIVSNALFKAKAASGGFAGGEQYPAWRRRHDDAIAALVRELEREGAAFTYRPPHDHAVRLAGIRSSSTGGSFGAVGNWLTAARKKLHSMGAAA